MIGWLLPLSLGTRPLGEGPERQAPTRDCVLKCNKPWTLSPCQKRVQSASNSYPPKMLPSANLKHPAPLNKLDIIFIVTARFLGDPSALHTACGQ